MAISTTTTTARVPRRLGRLAAVGAVALVLAGAAASPAEAVTRRGAATMTNTAIGICFEAGGDPIVEEGGGSFVLSCYQEDGSYWWDSYEYDQ